MKIRKQHIHELADSLIEEGQAKEMLNLLSDRLYTEPVHRTLYTLYLGLDKDLNETIKEEIRKIVSKYTESFTILKANGYFRNEEEQTLLIQIGADNRKIAYECAEELRKYYDQIAVGVVEGMEIEYKRVLEAKP
ncbi:MAG: hypothetical protein WC967_11535 [Balneolaceae bacterium]